MNFSQYGLQDSFKRAQKSVYNAYIAQGYAPAAAQEAVGNAILSQSYLRLEQPLSITNNVVQFPILVNATANNQTIRPTEVRLDQQDSFFCSSVSVYLAKAASATDSAFRLETYPSLQVFTLGAAGGEAVAPLNTFYNGYLRMNINKQVIVPNYPLSNFLQIPQTQNTAASTPPNNQFDPSQVALLEPNINLIGTKSNIISMVFPQNISALDAFTYAIIIFQGTLAQNVTLMS